MKPIHLDILRALVRLHRSRRAADLAALELRVPGSPEALVDALRGLLRADLIGFDGTEARLTLSGLALAVAAARRPKVRAARARVAA